MGKEESKAPLAGAKKKQGKFISEFKEFINRGNVVDLAVGVIIGGAFKAIVDSLVADIIMPVVSLVAGGLDFTSLTVTIPNFFGGDEAAVIAYGKFIQNVVNFLIVAWAIFILVKFINRLNRRKQQEEKKAEVKEDPEEIKLLREIRDSLKKKK